jgi:hypothetical protein
MNIYLLEWGSIADYEFLKEKRERVLKPFAKEMASIVGNIISIELHEVSNSQSLVLK